MESNNFQKLISIIVPVYNAEEFLNACISSIINQTYKNFELILIDDGSSDKSGDICDHWYKEDKRVKVVHQMNQGVAAARNKGLDLAKGEYVCFVDNDDFIKEDHLETFIKTMESTDSDIVICDIVSSKLGDAYIDLSKEIQMNADECMQWLINPISKEYVVMVVLWNKLYKRELFSEHRFEKGIHHEDEFMINRMLKTIKKATFIPCQNYVYRNNETSLTGEKNKNKLYHLEFVEAYKERINMALENGTEADQNFAENVVKWSFLKLGQYYKNGDNRMKEVCKKKYAEIFDEFSYLLTSKQKAKYKMFMVTPALFCKTFIN